MLFLDWFRKTRAQIRGRADDFWSALSASAPALPPRHVLDISELEDRVMLSASPLPLVVDAIDPALADGSDQIAATNDAPLSIEDGVAADHRGDQETLDGPDQQTQQLRRELVFVDSSTNGYQQLVDDLLAGADPTREFEVRLLDANRDGIEQISAALARQTDVDAIHLVSHGTDGQVKLGNAWLNTRTLSGYAGEMATWNDALRDGADLLIYGCDLAANETGQELVEAISELCNCDVAASTDDTGHVNYGGNWELEYAIGAIETGVAFGADVQHNWVGKLSIITVDTFADVINGSDGVTSLREAIRTVNAGTGGDTIELSALGAGTFTLAIGGTDDDSALTGDLDITKSVTIIGAGAGSTVINANGIDRVFHIISGTVTMSQLTIQGGNANAASPSDGGGVLVDSGATVSLSNVDVVGNNARNGGGIKNQGTLSLNGVTIDLNTVTQNGGGLTNTGTSILTGVTVSNNIASANGGGIEVNPGSLIATNVTISGNTAGTSGGGIFSIRPITLQNVTVADNTASFGSGVYLQGAGTADVRNTIVAGNNTSADIHGGFNSLGNNLIGNKGTATGFTNGVNGDQVGSGTLNIGSLQNNGGPTNTHALLAGSTAINAGHPSGAPATDQRGFAWVGIVDIGAFEFGATGNSAPTDIMPNSFSINENINTAGGVSVGTLTATDPDTGESFSYAVVGGMDQLKFTIGGAGNDELILTDGILDFEIKPSYSVLVRVTDSASNTYEKTLTVNVNDVYAPAKIYWADFSGNRIQRSNLDGTNVEDVVVSISGPSGLAIDESGGKIYWTEFSTQKVRRANLDGSGIEDIATGIQGASGITLDLAGGKIYFIENGIGTNTIRRTNLDGSSPQVLVTLGVPASPESIQLDIASNTMYWTDSFTKKIQKANLDGSGVQDVLTGLIDPKGLSLDVAGGKMYWVEDSLVGTDYVRRANLDGTGLEILVGTGMQNPYGIIVNTAEAKVYWSDYGTDKIQRSNLDGTDVEDVVTGLAFPVNLAFGETDGALNNPIGMISDTNASANLVLESATTGSAVGITAFADDIDAGDTVTYSLDNSAGGLFAINATTGVVTVNGALDAETATSHNIVVRAISSDTTFSTLGFTITVSDVNESSISGITDSNPSSDQVNENASNGTIVGLTAFAFDADVTNNTITYSLTSNPDGLFQIDINTGVVTTAAAIDRETHGALRSITVQAASSDGSTQAQVFNITINDLNEFDVTVPTDSDAAVNEVDENATNGTTVGITANAFDQDANNNIITYSLDDNAGGRFAIHSSTGVVTVANGLLLDRETAASHNITVRATSSDASSTARGFTINVFPLNDNLPVFTSGANQLIDENKTIVHTLTATDADLPGQSVTFLIASTGADRLLFAVDGSDRLVFLAAPDFETALDAGMDNVYDVDVMADDGNGGVTIQSITVTINDLPDVVNTSPTITTTGFSLNENSATVGAVAAFDPDPDTMTWSITNGGPDDALFSINASSGALEFRAAPDFESPADANRNNVYEVEVRVNDGSGGTGENVILVTVRNANDAPVSASDAYSVESNQTLTVFASGVLANDIDQDNNPLTAVLVGGPANGTLLFNPDGSFIYTPNASFAGTDSFGYHANDGTVDGNLVTVVITVNPIAARPALPPPPETVRDRTADSETSAVSTAELEPVLTPISFAAPLVSSAPAVASPNANLRGGESNENVGVLMPEARGAFPYPDHGVLSLYATALPTQQLESMTRAILPDRFIASIENLGYVLESSTLWHDLDELRQELEGEQGVEWIVAGASLSVTTAVTAGYVLWTIRGGWLVSSLLAQMPAWRLVDPLMVLDYLDEEEDDLMPTDDEDKNNERRVEKMFDASDEGR